MELHCPTHPLMSSSSRSPAALVNSWRRPSVAADRPQPPNEALPATSSSGCAAARSIRASDRSTAMLSPATRTRSGGAGSVGTSAGGVLDATVGLLVGFGASPRSTVSGGAVVDSGTTLVVSIGGGRATTEVSDLDGWRGTTVTSSNASSAQRRHGRDRRPPPDNATSAPDRRLEPAERRGREGDRNGDARHIQQCPREPRVGDVESRR